jgi:hypothetical protein
MAGKAVTWRVVIRGKPIEIRVYQKSSMFWVAAGEYQGAHHEVKGTSDAAAARAWVDAAKYHSD